MSLITHFTVRTLAAAALSVAALSSASAAPDAAAPAASAGAVSAASPETFIKTITADVLNTVKSDKGLQAGDIHKVVQVVDTKIMPNVDFQRMTASAVGRSWRQATPDQRKRLQDEFKTLLVYTYAGAASQVRDQTVEFKPSRNKPDDTEVVVRTIVRGKGEPVQLDYRLEKAGDTWKIYDVNVLGAWLVQTYQSSFAQEVNASGIDGLIDKLAERNKQLAAKKAS
ncbi:MAG: ABC transporter substrate-binding protein [Aquabacterium sp.]